MKKIALYISLALALVGGQFISSCSDDKEYPPVIVPEDYGSGKWDNPVSVGQVVEGFTGDDVWMTGYIVGWIDTGISNAYSAENVKFETPATVASNMLVAATPDERDITKCVPVQLVSGSDARKALNLVDNPDNLGKRVSIKGNAARYFGTAGFKSVSAFNWDKIGIEEETPDTPDTPDVPVVDPDYGKWDKPLTVDLVVDGFTGDDVWMTGYIVGWIDTGNSNAYSVETAKFATPATVASNMLVAASANERDIHRCVPVQLVAGSDARKALNLVDNPANLGKQVTIKGNAAQYFGSPGFKNVSAYNWGNIGVEETAPTGEQIFKADKSSGLDAFTFENVVLPSGSSYVWKVDSKYGLVASSFFSGACHASEAWAISPTIDLTGYKSAVLTFRHAGNKFESAANFAASCTVAVREDGGAWTSVTVPNMCEGTSWTFIDSGNVDLTSFAGKKIQFGFHYVSTDAIAGSWEIDAIKVNAGK